MDIRKMICVVDPRSLDSCHATMHVDDACESSVIK